MLKSEIIMKEYEIGNAIFKQLFDMNDTELKEKLISITGDPKNIFKYNCDCIRTIKNSEPVKIEFCFYDCLIVDWMGISIKPEHGVEYFIVKFNNHFKI